MPETRVAPIIRIVLLIWLVASIALLVAMVITLRPLRDHNHGPKENAVGRSADLMVDRGIAAATYSPIVNPRTASPFRHLNRVSYFSVQNTESRPEGRASLWRSHQYGENQIE